MVRVKSYKFPIRAPLPEKMPNFKMMQPTTFANFDVKSNQEKLYIT